MHNDNIAMQGLDSADLENDRTGLQIVYLVRVQGTTKRFVWPFRKWIKGLFKRSITAGTVAIVTEKRSVRISGAKAE